MEAKFVPEVALKFAEKIGAARAVAALAGARMPEETKDALLVAALGGNPGAAFVLGFLVKRAEARAK